MADLTDLEAAQTVKIVGASSLGIETNPVNASANGDMSTVDGLRNGGVYGALSIPNSNTPVEVKVGASKLTNRKFVQITATTSGLFWGLSSSVTVANGQPLANNQTVTFTINPNSTFEIWLVRGSNNGTARIVEAP